MNPHHRTPTGDPWAGGLKKPSCNNKIPSKKPNASTPPGAVVPKNLMRLLLTASLVGSVVANPPGAKPADAEIKA